MDGATLFPPSATPAPAPRRKRCPPGKRRSQGYIPRPPNAFMLFRADFVRQKHVPGSIETNHGSLSKIIGNCWRSLPPNEKRVWEQRAKTAKAEHKIAHPDYRFRPVHNK
ncbi:high mobility group box domain-containing protein, partial [Pterulicium gracile]